MEGQWWESSITVQTWGNFRRSVIKRFNVALHQNPYESLLDLKQSGSIKTYRNEFELLAVPLHIADQEYLQGIFISGLKKNIQAELKMHQVASLQELMNLAQFVEEKNEANWEEQGRNIGGSRNYSQP